MSDLRSWIDQQLDGESGAEIEEAPGDELEERPGEWVETIAEGENHGAGEIEAEAAEDVFDEDTLDAFWEEIGTLTTGQWEQLDPRERDHLWHGFLDRNGLLESDDASSTDDAHEGQSAAVDVVPSSPAEVVEWAFQFEDELRAAGWDAGAQGFLVEMAANPRTWIEWAGEIGWNAEIRPQQRHLPASVGLAAVAAGIPGARIVEDPLQRMRPSSRRRLW